MYEKGGFFLPHRDSEKHDRMVASLIVVLPNPFEGGRLVVRHGAAKQNLRSRKRRPARLPCYAAFYADCEHEVERVTGGVRLCLAYNLVLKPKRGKPSAAANTGCPPTCWPSRSGRGSRTSRRSRWSSRWNITTRSADCRWIC